MWINSSQVVSGVRMTGYRVKDESCSTTKPVPKKPCSGATTSLVAMSRDRYGNLEKSTKLGKTTTSR